MRNTLLSFLGVLTILSTSLITVTSADAAETKYFSSLRYNHVSLHTPIKGILPISHKDAQQQSHYVFNYHDNGQLAEIINNTYNNVKLHPLTHFAAKRVEFTYGKGKEIRKFYDVNNVLMPNIRGVYQEVYQVDDNGFVHQLNFYDDKNQAMESRWKISEYRWHQEGNLVIEQRVNLKNEKQPLSPYFIFNDTGIEYDDAGNPIRHYNLDANFNVVNNDKGIAYYQDEYDASGKHTKYAYYDENRQLTYSPWKFAYAIKNYDEKGYYTGRTKYDLDGSKINDVLPFTSKNPELDPEQIKQVALGYLTALKNLDPELMEQVLHKDLAKHSVLPFPGPDGKQVLRATSFKRMIEHANHWNRSGSRFPPVSSNKVAVLDHYNNMATVKMVSDNWVEYLHLVKLNGQWKIKNLIWDYNR